MLKIYISTFRNFIEDCLRCTVDFSFTTKTIDTSLRSEKEKMVKDIIEVFNDSTLYAELLSKCTVNDLLEQRCKELYILATDSEKNV